MNGKITSRSTQLLTKMSQSTFLPRASAVEPATDEEIRKFNRISRQYFIHGKEIDSDNAEDSYPLWLAPFLNEQHSFSPFPAIYLKDEDVLVNLRAYLEDQLPDLFPGSESIQSMLDQVIPQFQDAIAQGRDSYQHLISLVFKAIPKVIEARDATMLKELENKLISVDAIAIGFSHLAAFQILDIQLRKRAQLNAAFLKRINICISGLNELLHLHGKHEKKDDHHFGFADELISFDRIADIEAPVVSSDLPDNRISRIEYSLNVLQSALQAYQAHNSVIITSSELADSCQLKGIFDHALVIGAKTTPSEEARKFVQIEIEGFTALIAAIKLAELEIGQKYEDDLHSSYFEAFDSSYLGAEDLNYFRPLIVIEKSQNLIRQSQDLLSLISGNANVKVLAVYSTDFESQVEDGLESSALELASFAIARRNAFIYQGTIASPNLWHSAIERSLEAARPALWHILAPVKATTTVSDLLTLSAATESRYFPNIVYDAGFGEAFGSHFDISENIQSEKVFPDFHMEVMTASGKEPRNFEFTVADYLGSLPELRSKLFPVPPDFEGEYLVEVTAYLFSAPEEVAHKLPFIWIMEKEQNLMKAVVPLSWIQQCRSRIEYWQFLQELGGTNNYHVHHALEASKKEWDQIKKEEIASLKMKLQAEFDKVRSKDLERAVKRMLNMLLNSDNGMKLPLVENEKESEVTLIETHVQKTPLESSPERESSESADVEVSSEVWVDSDECTSCNDCTEALPGVFKYNDDKQAYVHNPKGGSYAKIVAAAEKCPAACIHPGLPYDKTEPHLEKLIKRAEKFN